MSKPTWVPRLFAGVTPGDVEAHLLQYFRKCGPCAKWRGIDRVAGYLNPTKYVSAGTIAMRDATRKAFERLHAAHIIQTRGRGLWFVRAT